MADYTEHYQLHQWEPEDSFLRTDFNEDHEKIDTALNGLAEQNAALGAALALCGNCEMEVVTYTGTGTYGQNKAKKITFSCIPDIYLISGNNTLILGRGAVNTALMIASDSISGAFVDETDVSWSGSTLSLMNIVSAQYQMNTNSKQYWVLGLHIKTT